MGCDPYARARRLRRRGEASQRRFEREIARQDAGARFSGLIVDRRGRRA